MQIKEIINIIKKEIFLFKFLELILKIDFYNIYQYY